MEVVVVMGESGWKFEQPTKVLARATLAESLTNDLQEKAKKAVVVDCGTGIFGYSAGDTLTCTAARKGAKKLGSMTVNFTDGGYKWQAEGI